MEITEVDEQIARSIAFRLTPLLKYLGGDEEDALQEALIALWETYDPEDPPSFRYHKTIWRAHKNIAKRFKRRKRVRLVFPERFDYGRRENVDDKLDALYYLDRIDKYRDLVERYFWRGESYAEIADSLGISPDAAKQRVYSALYKLCGKKRPCSKGGKRGAPTKKYSFDLSRLDGKTREVAELLNRGLSRKEVAVALGVSAGTVDVYIEIAKSKISGRYDQYVAKTREYGRTRYLRKKLER